jgi:hypothetical protein
MIRDNRTNKTCEQQFGIFFCKGVVHMLKYHAMRTCGGVKMNLLAFLTSALDVGEWSASRSGLFNFRFPHYKAIERYLHVL